MIEDKKWFVGHVARSMFNTGSVEQPYYSYIKKLP